MELSCSACPPARLPARILNPTLIEKAERRKQADRGSNPHRYYQQDKGILKIIFILNLIIAPSEVKIKNN